MKDLSWLLDRQANVLSSLQNDILLGERKRGELELLAQQNLILANSINTLIKEV